MNKIEKNKEYLEKFYSSFNEVKMIITIIFDENHLTKTIKEIGKSVESIIEKEEKEGQDNVHNESQELADKILSDKLSLDKQEEIYKLAIEKNFHIRNPFFFLNSYAFLLYDKKKIKEGLDAMVKAFICILFNLKISIEHNMVNDQILDDFAACLDTFGYGLYLNKKYDFSFICFSEAINIAPNHEDILEFYINRGISKLKIGDESGREDILKAKKIDEKHALDYISEYHNDFNSEKD